MDWKKAVGTRIKNARKGAKLTLAGLAVKTDGVLTASRISNYEQGTRLPGPREIKILGRALSTSPAHLMCLDEEEGEMTPDELQLLSSWRTLPESERKAYLRRITALSMVYRDPVPDERAQETLPPAPKALRLQKSKLR